MPQRITEPCWSNIILEGISNVLSALASAVRKRIGWSSLASFVSVAIVALAAIALHKLLHSIDIQSFVAAPKAQPPHGLLLVSGFVAANYFMLTYYDVFALRAIGRRAITYRAAALASFTSYTIGLSSVIAFMPSGACGSATLRQSPSITSLTYWLGCALQRQQCSQHAIDLRVPRIGSDEDAHLSVPETCSDSWRESCAPAL